MFHTGLPPNDPSTPSIDDAYRHGRIHGRIGSRRARATDPGQTNAAPAPADAAFGCSSPCTAVTVDGAQLNAAPSFERTVRSIEPDIVR
ncbi:hypothetical protein ASG56_10980 [Rhodococcus sp. Leaf7]|nr:hypothetical protein ASG56_10980 [Rhodococcus sp. Leaf7]KQU40136.1 hypothetical protein ASG64_10975 [Rhodococcus sp. Leaf247]